MTKDGITLSVGHQAIETVKLVLANAQDRAKLVPAAKK